MLISDSGNPAIGAEERVIDPFFGRGHRTIVALREEMHWAFAFGTIRVFSVLQPHGNSAKGRSIVGPECIGASEGRIRINVDFSDAGRTVIAVRDRSGSGRMPARDSHGIIG